MCFHTSLIRPAFHSIRYSSLKINTVYPGLSHNHESFQCETYVIHSGQLRQGIQFSCNCNIKVTWLPEVGVTIKYKWGIMHSILCCTITLFSNIPMYELFSQFTCIRDTQTCIICLIQRLNRKWPLHFLLSELPMMLCVVPSFCTWHSFATHVNTAIWASLIAGLDIWNRTMEWKKEWNSEHTQLQLTRVTGAAQSRLNYLVYS